MKNLSLQNQLSYSTQFAIGCFGLGTLLLALFMLFPSDPLLMLGFYYVLLAAALNLLVLGYLIIQFFLNWAEKTETLIQILILLSNIPIAIFYFSIVCNSFNH